MDITLLRTRILTRILIHIPVDRLLLLMYMRAQRTIHRLHIPILIRSIHILSLVRGGIRALDLHRL